MVLDSKVEDMKDTSEQIWDINYLSTSDEEDNDSDSDEEAEESKEVKKTPKVKEKDIVSVLLEKDDELRQRDLKARLLKIQMWKAVRSKFGLLDESYDETENFSWWEHKDNQVFYAMGTKHKTFYKEGD
jgi:hypothetical protein